MKDAAGRPVAGGELAVVVVDESVLALTGYKLEDPLAVFYAQRGADVSDYHLRKDVQLADPGQLQVVQGGAGGGGRGTAGRLAGNLDMMEAEAPKAMVMRRSARSSPARTLCAAPSARRPAARTA